MGREKEIFVELGQLSKKYGEVSAVNEIDLKVYSRELICLLGPSGCGKTTTMRLVAGLEKITSGHIYIGGKHVDNIPSYERDIGMVFQNYALFPHMTVFQNVAFGLEMRKYKKDQINEKVSRALDLVKLKGLENRTPRQLSGGQQQRVALARAIVIEPKILLLDEPLSNLDAKLRIEMRVELRNLIDKLQITTIYVTHDQEEALSIADRIVVMNRGKIEQIGTPSQLYELPANLFVAQFIGLSNIINGNVLSIQKDGEIAAAIGKQDAIRGKCQANERLSENQKVYILVRPEKIRLDFSGTQGGNSIDGEIRNIVYLGNTVRYYIENRCGEMMMAENQMSDIDQKTLRIGDRITMGWSSKNCLIFPN